MADVIKLTSGDSRPNITILLTDDSTGLPLDVSGTGCTVVIKFREQGTTTVLATLSCTKPNGGGDGKVQFNFAPNYLNGVAAGQYEGEIVITFADGTVQSIYDPLKFRVRDKF